MIKFVRETAPRATVIDFSAFVNVYQAISDQHATYHAQISHSGRTATNSVIVT